MRFNKGFSVRFPLFCADSFICLSQNGKGKSSEFHGPSAQRKNGQWWRTKAHKTAREASYKQKRKKKEKKKEPQPALQFPAKTGDRGLFFLPLCRSCSPSLRFGHTKLGCIRPHEGGSLVAHQAAGRPQESSRRRPAC